MDDLTAQDLLQMLLYRERLQPLLAEAVAAHLDRLPAGSRIGIYPCAAIARTLLACQAAAVARHRPVFLLTDPKDQEDFEGYPVRAAGALREDPPDQVIILNSRYQEAMAAEVAYLSADRVQRLVPLLEAHGLPGLLARVRQDLEQRLEAAIGRMEAELPAGRERVLFLASDPPLHFVKVMREVVRQGYAVAAVVGCTPAQGEALRAYAGQGYFHSLYLADHSLAREFQELERRLRPALVHAEVSMGPPQALAEALSSRTCPAAVEYRDFPQTVFRTREEAIAARRQSPSEHDQEQEAHRKIYLGADGIVMKDAPAVLDFLEERYGHRPRHVLPFFHYFSEEMAAGEGTPKDSDADGQLRVVYAGGVVDDPGWHNYPLYHSLLEAGRVLGAQGIHLTVYNAGDPDGRGFPEYRQLAAECPTFHYHGALPYRELRTVLPRHDFGWLCFDFSAARENPFFHRITMGSKVFTYLEAGLPVLVSPEQEFMADLVARRMGSGIHLRFADLPRLGQILRAVDWDPIRANIRRARQEWTYARHGDELKAFYELLKAEASRFRPASPML